MALSRSRKLLEPLSACKPLSRWESGSTDKVVSGLDALPVVEAEPSRERPQGLGLGAEAVQLSVKGATGRGVLGMGVCGLVVAAAGGVPEDRRRP